MFIFSFKKCESELEVKRVKRVYLIIFIILFIASILIVAGASKFLVMPVYEQLGLKEGEFVNIEEKMQKIENLGKIIKPLSIIFSIYLFYITIWACLKLGIGKIPSILWAFVALWPFVSIVSLIIILNHKPSLTK